jgi:nucleotide-binding universal stress UspA family protein
LGGSLFYALDGFVDIRLSMIILAGSLFGIQIGAIGTTYVKDYVVKFVMAAIMLLVLVSRFFYIPGYLSELGAIQTLEAGTRGWLDRIGEGALVFALLFGALMILQALYKGMREHRLALEAAAPAVAPAPAIEGVGGAQLSPVGRFERFLVASDGSEFSAAAVREAIGMATKCGAQVHVMSLVAPGVEHEGLGESILKQELATAQAHLDGIKVQAQAAGVACQTHLVQGNQIHEEIVDLADRIKADVIVMGRRGRRGLARLMLGHATAQVIGQAHCNVLVVPRAAQVQGRHMVLATDGSRFADTAAVTAGALARVCKTPVTVVAVTTDEQSSEVRAEAAHTVDRVVALMRADGTAVDGKVLHGEPASAITGVARESQADLIVTGSHGRTGLERVLIGSTSERILNDTQCAVLVVKGA